MASLSTQTINLSDMTNLIHTIEHPTLDSQSLLSLIDYTFLNDKRSQDALDEFVQSAYRYPQLAGICVYAHHLHLFKQHPSKKVTVVNFPAGDQNDFAVFGEFDSVINVANPDEIDYVFPYQAYLDGAKEYALHQCKKVIEHSRRTQVTIKIIIESGEFTSPTILYELCKSILEFQPDFIKTSTGFSKTGATFEAVSVICQAIKDSGIDCGVKVSGGIRDALAACRYIFLAETILNRQIDPSWFRIGASQLVRNLT
ncbi:deoxyribose-phosphate aldolase [Legionella sp. W05-934-2]|jgi:deoxyribose-phosphate aldolase|uniref:deoxyribose-phosphate aldolase n=1 Tax=Legionella sp. W05-934-2 TaxID=1198649 RepID=UPI0034630EC1